MTLRLEHLVFADDDRGYLPPVADADRLDVGHDIVLSLVRHIMRERNDWNRIPVVNAVYRATSPNQYGDNVFIDVTYHTSGYRATYGCIVGDTGTRRIQCYMD